MCYKCAGYDASGLLPSRRKTGRRAKAFPTVCKRMHEHQLRNFDPLESTGCRRCGTCPCEPESLGVVPRSNTTATYLYLGRKPECTVSLPAYTCREGHMVHDEICVCGHPQPLHR